MFGKIVLFGVLIFSFAWDATVVTSITLMSDRNQFNRKQAILRPADNPVVINVPIVSNGTQRSYLISVPDDYDEESSNGWPLIIDFHGRHGSPGGQRQNSQYYLNPLGRGYFVAYPLGCLGAGNHGGPPQTAWQGAPYANKSCNDILLTSDLIKDIQCSYNIDRSRIYASGKSNGGGFVDTLACSITGDLFAAFAMAAAALYNDTLIRPNTCIVEPPRPILEAHGACDTTIPINGSRQKKIPNIAQWTGRWAERNKCHPDDHREIISASWGRNTTYACNGTQGFIQQYNVTGLGHCWPSMVNNTDTHLNDCNVHTLDYTQAVLEFFARWQKNDAG